MPATRIEPSALGQARAVCTEPPSSTPCSAALPCGSSGWGAPAFDPALCRGEAQEPLERTNGAPPRARD